MGRIEYVHSRNRHEGWVLAKFYLSADAGWQRDEHFPRDRCTLQQMHVTTVVHRGMVAECRSTQLPVAYSTQNTTGSGQSLRGDTID